MTTLRPNSLVLYKNRPAKVQHSSDKLEIELEDGRQLKVRPKDIALLHAGPLVMLPPGVALLFPRLTPPLSDTKSLD